MIFFILRPRDIEVNQSNAINCGNESLKSLAPHN